MVDRGKQFKLCEHDRFYSCGCMGGTAIFMGVRRSEYCLAVLLHFSKWLCLFHGDVAL